MPGVLARAGRTQGGIGGAGGRRLQHRRPGSRQQQPERAGLRPRGGLAPGGLPSPTSSLASTWRTRTESTVRWRWSSLATLDRRRSLTAAVGLMRNDAEAFAPYAAWLIEDGDSPRGLLPTRDGGRGLEVCADAELSVIRFLSMDRLLVIPGAEAGVFVYDTAGALLDSLDAATFFAESGCDVEPNEWGRSPLRDAYWRADWLGPRRHRRRGRGGRRRQRVLLRSVRGGGARAGRSRARRSRARRSRARAASPGAASPGPSTRCPSSAGGPSRPTSPPPCRTRIRTVRRRTAGSLRPRAACRRQPRTLTAGDRNRLGATMRVLRAGVRCITWRCVRVRELQGSTDQARGFREPRRQRTQEPTVQSGRRTVVNVRGGAVTDRVVASVPPPSGRVCWDLVHARVDDLRAVTVRPCAIESEFADTRLRADLRGDRAVILLRGGALRGGDVRAAEAFEARIRPAAGAED